MKALLTQSRARAMRACQRLHRFQYQLGYRPVAEVAALRFGTVIHKCLAAWWRAAKAERLDAAMIMLASLAHEVDAFDMVRAQALLAGYHLRWIDEPYEALAVEVEFLTELRNPETGAQSRTWDLAGALDVVIRHTETGRQLLMEHKTSSEDITPGSKYWRRLRMDGQVSLYFEGGRSLGFDIEGCVYDVLGKPTIRPLRATPEEDRKYTKPTKKDPVPRLYANQREADETPEEFRLRLMEDIAAHPDAYFQRGEVARLEQDMADALSDLWQLAQQIREAEVVGRAPRNPDACERFGRLCPYFDVCTGAASLEDPALFERSDTIHPELPGLTAQQEAAP